MIDFWSVHALPRLLPAAKKITIVSLALAAYKLGLLHYGEALHTLHGSQELPQLHCSLGISDAARVLLQASSVQHLLSCTSISTCKHSTGLMWEAS